MLEPLLIRVERTLTLVAIQMAIIDQLLPVFEEWGYSVFLGNRDVPKHLVPNLKNPDPWVPGHTASVPWEAVCGSQEMEWLLAKYFLFRDTATNEDITLTLAQDMRGVVLDYLLKTLPIFPEPKRKSIGM